MNTPLLAAEFFIERDLLTHAGKVEKAIADKLACDEYDQFQTLRLAAQAAADNQAFEIAVKNLPVKKTRVSKRKT